MTELPVDSVEGFAVGDYILIDPGGTDQEDNQIAGFASILLASPLLHSHSSGESVIKILAGDGDCSGSVTIDDVVLLLKQISQLVSDATCSAAWNVDCTSAVDAVDALVILRSLAGAPALPTPSGCHAVGT
jgi:hypothetical protein